MEKKDHEVCLRCGRKLKNPQARERGYGAVCERKIRVSMSKGLFEIPTHLQSPAKKELG